MRDEDRMTYIAATLPLVLSDPIASPFRPRGPTAILILPPRVKEPEAMNDL